MDAFVNAASAGALLWVRWADGQPEICSGVTPTPPLSSDVGRLFVEALRDRFGIAASAVAERQWHLGLQPRRLLPARTVRRAVACAETALSLLLAQSHLMQIEFSAVMLGWRFRRLAAALDLDAAAMPMARRQALDEALAGHFSARLPAEADVVAERLAELLRQRVH